MSVVSHNFFRISESRAYTHHEQIYRWSHEGKGSSQEKSRERTASSSQHRGYGDLSDYPPSQIAARISSEMRVGPIQQAATGRICVLGSERVPHDPVSIRHQQGPRPVHLRNKLAMVSPTHFIKLITNHTVATILPAATDPQLQSIGITTHKHSVSWMLIPSKRCEEIVAPKRSCCSHNLYGKRGMAMSVLLSVYVLWLLI